MLKRLLAAAFFACGIAGQGAAGAGSATAQAAEKTSASPGQTAYYVDAQRGDDSGPGTSPQAAWKTLARANRIGFAPGDRLLFAAGQTFKGTLNFSKSDRGTLSKPIVVASFGAGRAVIDGGAGDGFRINDSAFVIVRELNFVGCGRKNGSDGTGVNLVRTRDVRLDGLDVGGFRLAGVATGGDENTRITHVRAHDNGAAGITTNGGYDGLPRTRNLYIGDCITDNNPGDPKNLTNHSGNGIIVGGLDGGVIEYCEASENGWDMPRDGNGPVGIWGWNCDRLTIQHCISHDNKSPGTDGGGFDFDGGVTNSILQYNLSYNNVGCGYLLCQYPGAAPWRNNVVRYNLSIDDGSKNFHSGIGLWLGAGEFSDCAIYNNTIVNRLRAVSTLGDVPGMVYRNNIFLAGGDVLDGDFKRSRFVNNLYWSRANGALHRDGTTVHATLDAWAQDRGQDATVDDEKAGRYADPTLLFPDKGQKLPTDPRKLGEMRYYRPRPGSPALQSGSLIENNGGQDFFGRRLAPGKRPTLGASE